MTHEQVRDRLQPPGASAGDQKTYDRIRVAGVAARAVRAHARTFPHAALLYRRGKGAIRLFEMHDHKDLRDDMAPDGFVWIEPRIPPERLRLVIERARLVHRRHKESAVPYGFRWRKSTFDERGGLRLGDGEIGFTCATIVAAVFEAESFRLVDPEAWPAPDRADKAAREAYLDVLRRKDPDHARLLARDLDAPRISPEELVASAALHPELGTFENLQPGAAVVRARIGTE
jgi:hypothetical protein